MVSNKGRLFQVIAFIDQVFDMTEAVRKTFMAEGEKFLSSSGT